MATIGAPYVAPIPRRYIESKKHPYHEAETLVYLHVGVKKGDNIKRNRIDVWLGMTK